MLAPIVRIVLRYGAGAILGMEMGETLAGDADVIEVTTVALATGSSLAVEAWYWLARKYGWSK